MSLIDKFKGKKAPPPQEATAESHVFGLELTVEKKEGTLSVVGSEPYSVEDHYYAVTVKSTGANNEYPAHEKVWTRNYTRLLPGENAHVGTMSVDAVPSTVRFTGFRLAEDRSDPALFEVIAFVEDNSDSNFKVVSQSQQLPKEQVREICQQALEEERAVMAAEKERERLNDCHAATVRKQEGMKRHAPKITINSA